jgi:hypothetical protein
MEEELTSIRNQIENMPIFNQIEILQILQKEQIVLNENKNGVLVNLTDLPQNVINNLKIYINYVKIQETALNEMEKQKEDFKNIYFNNINGKYPLQSSSITSSNK